MEDRKESEEMRQVDQLGPFAKYDACSDSRSLKSSKVKARSLLRARLRAEEVAMEYELLKARNEVMLAELDSDSNDEGGEVESTSAVHRKVENYVRDCEKFCQTTTENEPVVRITSCAHPTRLDLPRVELETFDGNPRTYWRFIQQFRYYVEDRIVDLGQRFLYLSYYCRGRANKAIAECVALEPDKAFDRAKSILKDLYGREHVVARALLDELLGNVRALRSGSSTLNELAVSMQNCEIALGQMGYMSDLNSIHTMENVVEVLSLDAKLRWARLADETLSNGRQVNFADLCQFVSSEARVASSRYGMLASISSSNLTTDRPRFPKVSHVNQMSRNDSCTLCHYKHQLEDCERFISLSIPKRWNVVRRKHICYACLEQGHVASNCTARRQCRKANCSERHHELLHMEKIDSPQRACHAAVDNTDRVCLGVIPVRLTGPNGSVSTYALLDTGSYVSLVEKNLAERIGLVGTRTTLNLSTINSSRRVSSERVEIEINSVDDGGSSVTGLCHCITSLSIAPEVKDLNAIASQWPHLENLSFANIPDKRVRLLIGTDIAEAHWPLDRKLGRPKQPFAVRTPLGWTLLGPLSADRGLWGSVNLVKDNDEISKGRQLLYDTEFNDVALPERAQSYNESVASKLVKDSTVMKCGHFEIGIPWKSREPMPPDKIISDNGSNFVGAEMELRRKIETVPHVSIANHLMERNVEWMFNPPLSSHRGGIWERLIRSTRRILRSTIMEQDLTEERLLTFLTEAERILNSRPIVPASDTDASHVALTPNDLLLLNKRVRGVIPESITERYVKGWQQVNYLTGIFWKRWVREYIPTLQQRQKWLRPVRNFRIGDVVLVMSTQISRERWPIGVIDSVETSCDDLIRTVMVRTSEGLFRRDVRKLGLIEACD